MSELEATMLQVLRKPPVNDACNEAKHHIPVKRYCRFSVLDESQKQQNPKHKKDDKVNYFVKIWNAQVFWHGQTRRRQADDQKDKYSPSQCGQKKQWFSHDTEILRSYAGLPNNIPAEFTDKV